MIWSTLALDIASRLKNVSILFKLTLYITTIFIKLKFMLSSMMFRLEKQNKIAMAINVAKKIFVLVISVSASLISCY